MSRIVASSAKVRVNPGSDANETTEIKAEERQNRVKKFSNTIIESSTSTKDAVWRTFDDPSSSSLVRCLVYCTVCLLKIESQRKGEGRNSLSL